VIFLLVSILRFSPFSILSMVEGEIAAFLASSALLMESSSLIFLTRLRPKQPSTLFSIIVFVSENYI